MAKQAEKLFPNSNYRKFSLPKNIYRNYDALFGWEIITSTTADCWAWGGRKGWGKGEQNFEHKIHKINMSHIKKRFARFASARRIIFCKRRRKNSPLSNNAVALYYLNYILKFLVFAFAPMKIMCAICGGG